jgi:hypothetical protein
MGLYKVAYRKAIQEAFSNFGNAVNTAFPIKQLLPQAGRRLGAHVGNTLRGIGRNLYNNAAGTVTNIGNNVNSAVNRKATNFNNRVNSTFGNTPKPAAPAVIPPEPVVPARIPAATPTYKK